MAKPNTLGLIITLIGLAGIIYWIQTAEEKPQTSMEESQQASSSPVNSADSQIPVSTAPAIGGSFDLIDQNGHPFSSTQLLGKYAIIFFGFTHCPDMCPTAMSTLTGALAALDEETRGKIVPVFITIDPKRDTPEVIKAYLQNFDPRFVGLTGSFDQIKQAASGYKVYYETAYPEDQDYNVNHSGYMYLVSPEGKYIRHFSHNLPAGEIAGGIAAALKHDAAQGAKLP